MAHPADDPGSQEQGGHRPQDEAGAGRKLGLGRVVPRRARARRFGAFLLRGGPALTSVHGIGPWTADIYLLSCLGHADAWPAGDLALQEAARLAFALPLRPDAKQMQALAQIWRPWRAVAARVLWTYYRAVKGREGAPTPSRIRPLPKSKAGKTPRRRQTNGR